MARIDLIKVGKTLRDRGHPRPTPSLTETPSDVVSTANTGRGGATFSIENLDLTVHDGETMVILGPSGCGKTTLLRIIAGLMAPDSGQVRYDGVDVTEVSPGNRRIGMVFQNYALYPHLDAKANVLSYFMFRKRTPELDALAKAKYQRTSELMGVELAYLLDRKPTTLSGGEKQRVALGRCITRDPVLFLLDEPFSNLDQALREKYRVNLKVLLKQFDITTVYVTHDHYEALILADRLAVMNRGRIEQMGTYQEIYEQPRNLFVAGFLNRHVGTPPINLFEGRDAPRGHWPANACVGVRPEDLGVAREGGADAIAGVVAGVVNLPMMNATILTIRAGGEREVHAQAPLVENFRAGERVWLTFNRYHVFDTVSGARIGSEADAARR